MNMKALNGLIGAPTSRSSDAGFDDIGNWPQRLHCLGPYRSVIAGIGGIQHREAVLMLDPVEIAPINQDAADRGAVAADILGGRVQHDRSTMVERSAKHGRGRIVHD